MAQEPSLIFGADPRYSRQFILEQIGVSGQKRLSEAAVLVVGVGGLGCPCSLYLAASGIGCIGLVDEDTVDLTNLHRQILYTEGTVGQSKAEMARERLEQLNATIRYRVHNERLTFETAKDIFMSYDVVVDCTDNSAARYLCSDICALLEKPLVFGAAIGWEGQLRVFIPGQSPCYRCLHPKPVPPETIQNCAQVGVVGAMTGIIGSMQALEVLKTVLQQNALSGSMLVYSGLTHLLRVCKLRQPSPKCPSCGPDKNRSLLTANIPLQCKQNPFELFDVKNRITWEQYREIFRKEEKHVLIDVREPYEFETMHISNTVNIPLSILNTRIQEITTFARGKNIYILCLRGHRSKTAAKILSEHGISSKDIVGGLYAFDCKTTKGPVLIKP